MIKNGIISLLLIIILNLLPGTWAVTGFRRLLLNLALWTCGYYILCDIDMTINKITKRIRRRRRDNGQI